MADDVQLDLNTTSGAVVRTVQKSSVQYPVSILDVGTHPSDNTGTPSLVSKGNNVGMPVEGLADNGEAIQGSPVLIGAKYDSAPAAVDDGDMSFLVVDSNHNLRTTIYGDGTENGISISSTGAISVDALTKIDFDTTTLGQADQACVGIVVPSATGPTAIQSSSIQDTVSSVVQPSVSGLNVSQLGAFFFDGDNDDSADTVNVAAFGIAIASATGPKAIGSDGSTTTYLPVSVGNFPATQNVSGSVSVSNLPATQPVSGSVSVSNFPATQAVSGAVTATVSNFPATQPVSGSVSVSNFPATQPVSGSVSVSNFPATQPVSGTVAVSSVTGTVTVDGSGVTQPVSGTVGVSSVTGTVTVDGSAVTQPISGTVGVSSVTGTVTVDGSGVTQPISGNVGVTSISSGANAIGDVGLVGRNNTGLTFSSSIDVDENKDSLPSGATTLYGLTAFNSTNSPIYLKFWDQNSLTVTVGTTTPKLTFLIPANASSNGAGFVLNIPQGIAFTAQMVFAATTGVEATSTSGPATNGCIVNFFYKQ